MNPTVTEAQTITDNQDSLNLDCIWCRGWLKDKSKFPDNTISASCLMCGNEVEFQGDR